jgi:hypothetical protein
MKLSIEDRIKIIVDTCDVDLAIEKIHGYLKDFYWNQNVLNCIGDLYYKKGNHIKAGQYWYFKENKNEIEKMVISEFQNSLGNDFKLITRILIGHHEKSPKKLNQHTKFQLFKILETIEKKEEEVPDFAKNWYRHLKKEFFD